MEVELDVTKSVSENAAIYFEKAKKCRKKLEGAKKALDKKLSIKEKKAVTRRESKKREWYEKFHWCITSKGKLMIGGRDATTNEIIVKKHSETNDLVFHTDMKGSPFITLKDGKNASKEELLEAATFCLCNSKGWKDNILLEVFYVEPKQLSKEPKAGESTPAKGGFIVYGKTNYLHPSFEYAVGEYQEKVMGGPLNSIKANCKELIQVVPGNQKSSEIAKIAKKQLNSNLHLDEFIKALPSGGCKIKK